MTTLTIMRVLPREVDPAVFHMVAEDPGNVSYAEIGGLNEQIRELREVYLSYPYHPISNLSGFHRRFLLIISNHCLYYIV